MEILVEILVRQLSLEQLSRTAQCVALRIRHLTGQQPVRTTPFRSDSEKEEDEKYEDEV
jgi:hypothetical protein